jgi:hypothetical protein
LVSVATSERCQSIPLTAPVVILDIKQHGQGNRYIYFITKYEMMSYSEVLGELQAMRILASRVRCGAAF